MKERTLLIRKPVLDYRREIYTCVYNLELGRGSLYDSS